MSLADIVAIFRKPEVETPEQEQVIEAVSGPVEHQIEPALMPVEPVIEAKADGADRGFSPPNRTNSPEPPQIRNPHNNIVELDTSPAAPAAEHSLPVTRLKPLRKRAMDALVNLAAPKPERPSLAELTQRLQVAKSRIPALERAHRAAALDSVSGLDGAADKLVEAGARLQAAKGEIETLSAAVAMADEQEREAAKAARMALNQSALAALRQHLGASASAADRLQRSLEQAAKDWDELVARRRKAQAIGVLANAIPEQGAALHEKELMALLAREFRRVSGNDAVDSGWPGASRDFDILQNPAAVTPLAEEIRKANEYIVSKVVATI